MWIRGRSQTGTRVAPVSVHPVGWMAPLAIRSPKYSETMNTNAGSSTLSDSLGQLTLSPVVAAAFTASPWTCFAPYDAAVRPYSLDLARAWIKAAEAQHIQVLVAFYHSEYTPTKMPSIATYKHDVQKFVKLFPHVRQYQSWNEANRGNIPRALASPSAGAAARYYQALIRVCRGCKVVGLDVLDQKNISPTLRYISAFKREIGRLRTVMPRIWGLHNYSDVNGLQSWRTRALGRALGGQVWLTETGGIVQFGGAFPNRRGSGLKRAAKVLGYMFNVAGSQSRIRRLYIYTWTGGTAKTRFDAGLTDAHNKPRPGYLVVCKRLHGAKCNVKVSNH